jgi:hypothetical protein
MNASRGLEYQWHPTIHEQWAGEHLCFWRMAFSPTYDRERITGALRAAMELHGVTAYTIYELFAGGYDVFLRLWLPTSQAAFEADLHEALPGYQALAAPFLVQRIIVHWPWETQPGSLDIRPVRADALRKPLPESEIARINAGELSKADRERYENANLIAPLRRKKGIKFFTVVSANQQPMTRYAAQRLEERIKDALRDASTIEEKSLYAGVGFGQYLIMGRTRDYFAIEREITQPLNDAVDPSIYGARTTTFPVSRQEFLDYSYSLRAGEEPPAAYSAAEALDADESQTLEVKASAFVSVERWLRGDGALKADDRVVDDGILKAVTGLLNAEGGTLVLGALERERFDQEPALADLPRRGNYIVLGIEQDADGHDWDRYARRVRVLLEKRVRPDPNPWVSITRELIEGRTVGLLTIRPPEQWYYHYPASDQRPRFWARQGNRTVELVGPESDTYRREKAR